MKIAFIILVFAGCILLLDKWKDVLPRPIRTLYKGWEIFSHGLGVVVSKILLTILWLCIFGPYAIIWKCIQKKSSLSDTYWIDSDPQSSLEHQF